MNTYQIPKDKIDEKNLLIKDTIFEKEKNNRIVSGMNKIYLDSDDYVTYQLISGNYDLNSSLDRCMIDKDKMKLINAIQMYNLGVNYDDLLKLLMNNKYCHIFIETVLKDNPFTKNIIYYLCNIDSSNIKSYIDSDGNDLITWVRKNENEYSILEISKKLGDKINFDYVNSEGNTLLMDNYINSAGEGASEIINELGELCKPDYVNKYGDTALIMGCMYGIEYEVFDILKFGEKCKPEQVNDCGETALISACSMTKFFLASDLIDKFGEKCKPEQVDNNGKTALIYACESNFCEIIDIASKLIDKFGEKCKPEQVDSDGNTVLHHAIKHFMDDVALKLIDTFGRKCKPEQVNKDGKTALDCAIKNKMDDVVSKLKTLLNDQ
jgi:ankyrin repeat protein